MTLHHDKPLAAPGLLSYRYPGRYGVWIMLAALNDAQALDEAERSLQFGVCDHAKLERWNGTRYVKLQEFYQ